MISEQRVFLISNLDRRSTVLLAISPQSISSSIAMFPPTTTSTSKGKQSNVPEESKPGLRP